MERAHTRRPPTAIEACRDSLARGSKSFALASRLLPQPARDRAAVVYAWCRRADDAVDDAAPVDQPAALAVLEAELGAVYSEERPTDVTLAAFQDVARACAIPELYPRELLAGMAMDVRGTAYQSMDDLLLYCYRVASTVGLMMCHVMGIDDDGATDHAAHLGIAMQLTNICRDVAEDWVLGRLYLPRELLEGVGLGDLRASLGRPLPPHATAGLAQVVRELLDAANRYYRSGDAGLSALDWRSSLAIRSARLIYAAIGDRLAERNHDVNAGRAVVSTADKLRLIRRAILDEIEAVPDRIERRLRRQRRSVPASLVEPADVLPL